jgi:nitroreductase
MPEFAQVVGAQRACRAFGPEPVDDAVLERVLWAATRAPSAENRQPWVFVVVRRAERRHAIGALIRRAWDEGGRQHSEGRLPERLLAEVDQGATGGLAGAPVHVVVGADTARAHPATLASSVFPAVQNLLLAATAEGLGSVLTTLALRHADELAALLELAPTVTPMAVVPLGWPARPLGEARRRPLAEVAHRESFGTPW